MLPGCLILIPLSILVPTTSAFFRYVHVKGRLICGPVSNNSNSAITHQDVRLMEYDAIGPNDQLNATSTDEHGKFEISGSHKEDWGHEFFLSIIIPCWRSGSGSFSDCSNRGMMCNKNICEVHMRVDIPFEYYYTEDESKKTLDLGEIHMVKNKQSDRKYLNSYCPDM